MIHLKQIIASASALLIILMSCKKDPSLPVANNYPEEIGKIISNKCATSGCHNEASYKAAGNLNLTDFNTLFQGSSSGSPVIPYRSDFSTLCYFINTYTEYGPINNPTMPLNGNVLSKQEVKTIKDWIDNGAPDKNGNVMWADNPNRKKYYVLNQGCDVVAVFDANTQLPMRYITVGNKINTPELPHMIKISPDGQYWYVVFVANNILQKYRTSDDSFVGEVTLGTDINWNTLTISNDSKKAYCVSWQANSRLAIVDVENMLLLNNVGGGNFTDAHGVALNKNNDTIYITRQTGNYIYKIDANLNNGFQEISLDGNTPNQTSSLNPHEIIFSQDGLSYFVTCQNTNQVRVFNTAGDNLLQIISTGQYPLEFAISNARNKLYVSCQDEPGTTTNLKGSVTVIDMITLQSTNFSVGYQPHGLGIDEANNILVVASRNIQINGPTPHHTGVCGRNGFVSYFNINTMQLLSKKTEVASDPYSVAIKP
jgi:DNA-binding beta-propeller fold protein YncE